MKKLLCFIGGAMLVFNLFAQQIKPVEIGDQVPDLTFEHVMNNPKTQFKLSDLKGKLVILDFFGTWCGACIPKIPKLDVLQQNMKDRIQVIVICEDQSNEVVQRCIQRKWTDKGISIHLPFVLADSTTMSLFPHRMVPHEVWISPEGKLIATTDADEVTADNLRKAYTGLNLRLKMKVDQMDFNRDLPLFVNGNGGGMKKLMRKSLFSGKISGVAVCGGQTIDTATHTRRLYFINESPLLMLLNATHIEQNRIFLSKRGTLIPIDSLPQSWIREKSFSYELTIPDTMSQGRWENIMLKDVQENLDIYVRIEKKSLDCYVLQKTEDSVTPNNTDKSFATKNENYIPLRNDYVSVLTAQLQLQGFKQVVDETNDRGRIVNLNLPKDGFHHPELLTKTLAKAGFTLKPAKRRIKLLVIYDNSNQAPARPN